MAENRGGKDKTNCLFGFKLRKTSDNDFICITSVQSFAINIFAFIHVFLDDEKKNNNKMKNSTMKNIETITKENSDSEDSDDFDDTSDSDNRGEVDKIHCLFRFCSWQYLLTVDNDKICDNDLIYTKGVQSIAANISYQITRWNKSAKLDGNYE